jgi:hypothetical protein
MFPVYEFGCGKWWMISIGTRRVRGEERRGEERRGEERRGEEKRGEEERRGEDRRGLCAYVYAPA